MIIKYFFKKNVRDCLICAIRPLTYVGFTITYIGKARCPHVDNTDKPSIEENTTSTLLAKFCNLFLLADILYVALKLCKSDSLIVPPKYYYNIILPNYINTLNYTVCFMMNNSGYMKYTNGLITLLNKTKFFGVESVLTKKLTELLQLWSSFCFFAILAVCLLILSTTTPKEVSLESVLLATSMWINNINAMSFALYSITTLIVYHVLFTACFDSIYEILKEPSQKQVLGGLSFQDRLQFQQQFYIAVCTNYRRHLFGVCNVMFYVGQLVFTIFSVVQAYFSTFETADNEEGWILFFSKFFQIFLTIVSYVVCMQIHNVQFMSQDLISFLYKYKISKLSAGEASQVEMLLITLQMERPVLTASNLYDIGVTLLASIAGSAVTYVLVALQFHASFSTS